MPELHVIGTILSGSGFAAKCAYVRWRLVSGPEWMLLGGSALGHSQMCKAEPIEDLIVFGHPVDAHYACSSLIGWPKILVSVWQQDDYGRHEIAGYGVAFVPMSPGAHALEIATWRPAGSACQEFTALFVGGLPQLTDTSVVTEPAQRHLLSTVTTGTVLVELNVMCRDFLEAGVEFAAPKSLVEK